MTDPQLRLVALVLNFTVYTLIGVLIWWLLT